MLGELPREQEGKCDSRGVRKKVGNEIREVGRGRTIQSLVGVMNTLDFV